MGSDQSGDSGLRKLPGQAPLPARAVSFWAPPAMPRNLWALVFPSMKRIVVDLWKKERMMTLPFLTLGS